MAVMVSDGECQLLLLIGSEASSIAANIINQICAELEIPIHSCNDPMINSARLNLIETQLLINSQGHKRKRLLIAGAYLEEQITVCALHALSLGYEVFILKDFIAARNVDHIHAFDMRLFQAGVVLTTLRQLLYEWLCQEEATEREALKRQLLKLIDQKGVRPA